MSESRNEIGDVVDAMEGLTDMLGSLVNLLAARLPTREERLAEEERRAWDVYFAQMNRCMSRDMALAEVNRMLEARRKRFGSGKEAGDTVAAPRDLLVQCIEALRCDLSEEAGHLLAKQLRALVSE